MILSAYQPVRVLHHFEAISQIPRGSGDEKRVSDFIAQWAQTLDLKVVQDAYYNLVIYKPATAGYEGAAPVILQGHLDMVCEKNSGTAHDFTREPLKLYVDGDYIRAKGTTLGADNGIAVAMCMALLEADNVAHPPLEVVFTTDEEAGMGGAMNLDGNLLAGRRMINMDSSKEGTFVVGSAAGATAEYAVPVQCEAAGAFSQVYKLVVKGLTGGHSGSDIHRERGNALRILGNVLNQLDLAAELRIVSASGGMKVNAIPREAEAVIAVDPAGADKLHTAFEKCVADMKMLFRVADPGLDITLAAVASASVPASDPTAKVMAGPCGKNLIASLILLPVGVQCMSRDIEGMVAASCNIGVLETVADAVKISCMPRGASNEHNHQTELKIGALAKLTGSDFYFAQRSPAWPFNPDSRLITAFADCYRRMYGKDAVITALHAGLEGGIFLDKLPGLDIISMGPDIHDLHTPDERLSVSSTARVWEFLCGVLGEMNA